MEAAVVELEVAPEEGPTLLIAVENSGLASSDSATTSITVQCDEDGRVEVDLEVDTTRLESLYARFKASTFRFDFGDEANLATLAAIPLVQAHMRSRSTFTEHELFSIIFRFNRPYPSAQDEEQSVISRRLVDAELLEVATGLVLRCVLRTRYRDARVMMAHACGGAHNAPDLRFFLAHDQVFIVLPRQPQQSQHHNTINIDVTLDQSPESGRASLEVRLGEEEDSCDDDGDGDDGGGEAADGANPWVLLRVNVKHVITDKASVVAALRAILGEARDQRLTLLVLRQRFERDCGVPFGCAGCGSLTSFLKKQRAIFHVTEARKKKNLKSTVTLVSSSSPTPQPNRPPPSRNRTESKPRDVGRSAGGRGQGRGATSPATGRPGHQQSDGARGRGPGQARGRGGRGARGKPGVS
jgi:hypothetical protein